MKITDLMDDFYDESGFLPKAEQPTAARTRELTLNKLDMAPKARRRVPVGALVAAACVVVFSLTAGAVGYSLRDAARDHAGLSNDADIPEWQEYSETSAEAVSAAASGLEPNETCVEGARLELISTLCSGNDVMAYVSVSPVSQEIADMTMEENQGLYTFACWETGITELPGTDFHEGYSCGATLVEYDAKTETALLCLEFHGDVFSQAESIPADISCFHQWGSEEEPQYEVFRYGSLTFPITPSEAVAFTPNLTFGNDFLSEQTATLTEVSLGASYVSLTYEFPSLEAVCEEYGENAYFIIGDAYEGYYMELDGEPRPTEYDALDAEVYYGRSWSATLDQHLKTAFVTLTDGTEISLKDLQLTEITSPGPADTIRTETFQLPGALDITKIQSITFDGQTYTLQ